MKITRDKIALLSFGVALMVAGCGGGSDEQPGVATADFITMAKTSACTESRNRLFVIDQEKVFWDTAGTCNESPQRKLFGKTPTTTLCTLTTTLLGARSSCTNDADRTMFTTINNNLDKADLGLGSSHQVQAVAF